MNSESDRRSVDMLEDTQALALERTAQRDAAIPEPAGELVDETIPALRRVGRDELNGGFRFEEQLETIETVVDVDRHGARQGGMSAVLMQSGERAGKAPVDLRQQP